jgi:hypothetical protein
MSQRTKKHKTKLGIGLALLVLGASSVAMAQPRELNPNTAAERAQQGTRAYNLAIPQGCDAVEKGFCITVTKERDIEVPPDSPGSGKKR